MLQKYYRTYHLKDLQHFHSWKESAGENSSLFLLLLATFALLLARSLDEYDFFIDIAVTSNESPTTNLSKNIIPLHIKMPESLNVRQFLELLRKDVADISAHPGRADEKALTARREQGSNLHSCGRVIFSFEKIDEKAHVPGAESPAALQSCVHIGENVDLALALTEASDAPAELLATLEYNDQVYPTLAMQDFLQRYQLLLESLLATPEERISLLPWLTASERQQLLWDWNATAVAYPDSSSIADLFSLQAEQHPTRIALICNEQRLTYEELEQQANQLAHYLQKRGVEHETFVGIYMDRSPEMVIGLLAILKAGGCYVPLDPGYPPERLAFILEDTQAHLLLTKRDLAPSLPNAQTQIIYIDSEWPAIAHEPTSRPGSSATADSLAYVIYTSGSTGRPKGVLIQQRSISRLVFGSTYAHLDANETLLHIAPIAFDASTFELWGALLNGARCVLYPDRLPTPWRIGEVIDQHHVTTAFLTTALFNVIVDEYPQALGGLRQLLVGGEALSITHIRRALDALPATRISNVYGPTETTTFATHYPIPRQLSADSHSLPIGVPITNTQIYLLDPQGQPVPVGIPGEIFIGGAGVARGYLNCPALTAEKFLPNPFDKTPGTRIYKTGDLAYYLPDGSIEFLRRADQQVKLHGFRIEPGEVEAALLRQPGIREAVVLMREDTPGDKRLVGYIVGSQEHLLSQEAIRQALRSHLPAYMVPSHIVILDALPLTPNGKVNSKILPAPREQALEPNGPLARPRTPVEQTLAEIWADVLGLKQVNITDDFFALGGDSLLAMRIVARIREALGAELSLDTLFTHSSIAELAQNVKLTTAEEQTSLTQLRPVSHDMPLPLSFSQKRLWFLDQLEPGNPFYTVPVAFRFKGKLNHKALQVSLQAVVQRHEILRTTFLIQDGMPVQVISPHLPITLQLIDLSTLSAARREALSLSLAEREAKRPFDLRQGPLLRACLLRLTPEEHVFLLTLHHIITDGWSQSILLRELADGYAANLQGTRAEFPVLPIQYADYAVWQRQRLQGPVLEAQLAYWKEHLSGAPMILELPTDLPRPATQRYRGQTLTHVLPADLLADLQLLSQREKVTLLMTLMTGFAILLAALTGQKDMLIGTLIAGRSHAEVESLIGFFVNTLALRVDTSGRPTVRELLGRVKTVILEAFAHQEAPFEQVVEALQPERDLSRTPLVQALFQMETEESPAFTGLEVETLDMVGHAARFDLLLDAIKSTTGLRLLLEYNSDLFTSETMRRLLNHYEYILRSMVAAPQRSINDLEWLPPAERQQLLVTWNATGTLDLPNRSISDLFEQQVERTPHALALIDGQKRFTYQEVNERANQLAHYLQQQGVQADVLVGICLERSAKAVIAVLAVLKAGGAYVPLDPTYPLERLTFMLQEARASILLTQQCFIERFEGLAEDTTRMLCLESEWEIIAAQPTSNPHRDTLPLHLAYVIYTSGSTGRPKGIGMSQQALCNLLTWQISHASTDEIVKTAQFASLNFDVSFQEIFATWCAGGTLVLLSEELRRDSVALLHFMSREKISRLFLPFVALHHLAETACRHQLMPTSLRAIITAGEQLQTTPSLRQMFSQLDECVLSNQYGPSETHVVTAFSLSHSPHEWAAFPPIGRPIDNTQLYVLDEQMKPVPLGVPGELYIGGVGVARGYLNQPGMTAQRFVPDPFSRQEGARLYRTGDRARYRSDGNLEFLGRVDQQIKLRGFRIEPGEIEAALCQEPALREAVVVLREDVPGDKRLVAYVVPHPAQTVVESELVASLKKLLPAYMIPASFVVLDAFPLTPSGKVNRRALPAPERTRPELRTDYQTPRTPLEVQLMRIWSEVLGIEYIGTQDSFFELGGHSLLATQIVARIHEAFQVEISLRTFFETPTIAGLAKAMQTGRHTGSAFIAPPLSPATRDAPLPLSASQLYMWFSSQLEPENPSRVTTIPLRLKGPLNVTFLEKSLNAIVQRHEILRTTFPLQRGQVVQVIAPELHLPLTQITFEEPPGVEREAALQHFMQQQIRRPFNLARGPLLRVQLVRIDEYDHLLLITMHHIITDGWSLGVLFRELVAHYEGFQRNLPATLPSLPVQYADYAVWEQQWLQRAVLQELLAYWTKQLAQAPTVLKLPTDFPPPARRRYQSAAIRIMLPQELRDALSTLNRQEGASMFMTLLTGFSILLARTSGQTDLLIGTPTAKRTRVELENLIGMFADMLVLRIDLSGQLSLRELLRRVQRTALDAYVHQNLPSIELARAFKDIYGNKPLFHVVFSMHDVPIKTAAVGELTFRLMELDDIAASDWELRAREQEEGIQIELLYNTDLFTHASMARLMNDYQDILREIVTQPDQPLVCEISRAWAVSAD